MAKQVCSDKYAFLQGLLEEEARLRKANIRTIYRMGAGITVDVMLYIKDYFYSRPAFYEIEIYPCNTCSDKYDIIIMLKGDY